MTQPAPPHGAVQQQQPPSDQTTLLCSHQQKESSGSLVLQSSCSPGIRDVRSPGLGPHLLETHMLETLYPPAWTRAAASAALIHNAGWVSDGRASPSVILAVLSQSSQKRPDKTLASSRLAGIHSNSVGCNIKSYAMVNRGILCQTAGTVS